MLICMHIRRQNVAGINGVRITLMDMVSQYGHGSIEETDQIPDTSI
ncbi:MAG: hypothetical protein JEZ11_12295 [Desulfobacterales bacterium]|nr:hypothetical protein [Desulfobacterales bacterium]